jgi:hypothetical protein
VTSSIHQVANENQMQFIFRLPDILDFFLPE